MKDKAYKICREFLSGTWKSITMSDMVFKSVSGGLSNFLYYCSLPETHTPLVGEPSQVLLRMYGQLHEGKMEATITESVIFMLLSERKLGPRLYGIFPEGRLEEYIPARSLTCSELKDPDISAVIARKLARVHTLEVPINKEPTWMFDKMQRWLDYARNNICVEKLEREKRFLADQLLTQNFEAEIEWLKTFLLKAQSPILFCHNDLQQGNILFPDGPKGCEDKLVFIDFEYCSYNYRGFDIANHFCEWCYDYTEPTFPHFTSKYEDYPSFDQQRHFVRAYLDNMDPNRDTIGNEDNEEHILNEATAFTLASHMLWTLWCIYNAHTSKITFGYWEYGNMRMDAYYRWKAKCLNLHVERKGYLKHASTR